jgi:murein DD-endopeptidase MepM/ murein hydrolase activator NlpD
MIPNQTDGKLFEIVRTETPETLALLHNFDVNILDRDAIVQYPSICPIAIKDISRISSFYGPRIHPIYKREHIHTGIDLAANEGVDVLATGSGKVVRSSSWGGYGKQIIIDHENGFMTRYAHLSKQMVEKGDTVDFGQKIGEVGSTGLSTGNHLHYEIIHHNRCIDPLSIYPDTIQRKNYLSYLKVINDHYLSCSDNLFNL